MLNNRFYSRTLCKCNKTPHLNLPHHMLQTSIIFTYNLIKRFTAPPPFAPKDPQSAHPPIMPSVNSLESIMVASKLIVA